MNNYLKITSITNEGITCKAYGTLNKDDIVELYDNLNNPLGIFSHVETILMFGIEFDTIDHGYEALFILPGLDESILDLGMKLVRD